MATTNNYQMKLLAQGDLQPWATVNTDVTYIDGRMVEIDPFGGRPSVNYDANGALTTNLSYGYLGGRIRRGVTITVMSAGSVTCTASATNYVELDLETWTVSANTTNNTPNHNPHTQEESDATK